MGKGTSVTVGHKYLLGKHEVLCHGPIDSINRIVVDAKTAWAGRATGGAITIDAETLFGGSKSEWVVESTLDTITPPDNSDADGISGTVDILMGEPTQTKNSYLQSVLGELIPAFRGVVSVVLRQCYIGNSEYPKPWQYDATRIHVKENGEAQWYDAKAKITQLPETSTIYPYELNLPANGVIMLAPGEPGFLGIVIHALPSDKLVVRKKLASEGAVYSAWSPWINESAAPDPFVWQNAFTVASMNSFEDTTYPVETYWQSRYLDHSSAENAIADKQVILSGYSIYKIGIQDSPYSDNRGGLSLIIDNVSQQKDMNPAHIIRECDTSRIWGLGRPEYEINDASFIAAADQLYAEKMGMSLLWDQQKPIEEFIEEIKRHIDAVHYTDDDGLLTLKLIRDDYDINDLIVLDESNVLRVEHAASTPTTELVNSVTVIYWDPTTNKDASVTVSDPALVQMQGRIISTTIHYPGFTNANIATRAAMRDLRTLSNSLFSTQLVVNFSVSDLQKGSPFILNLPEYNAHNMVMRLVDINHGDGINNEIRITCTQDVFALPSQPVMTPSTDQQWVNPSGPATAVAAQLVFELPYYELVQAQGQAAVDSALAEPTTAALGVAAVRPNGAARNAQIMVDSGDGYRAADELDFCPSAVLVDAIGFTDTSITFENEVDLDLLVKGQHAQIDDELVVITALNFTARTATIGRGVLDTVPAQHAAGARIWFWDTYVASDTTTYTEGETLSVKVLTNSSSGRLALSSAAPSSVEFAGRAARPYPPGKLLINGTAYPATIGANAGLSLAWAHRDRLLQTAGTLQDSTVGDIGPEPGTTYTLRIYTALNALLKTFAGIATNFYNYTTSQEEADMGGIGGGRAIEPFWDKTVLLANMNATNGSTIFIDSSPNFAIPNGNVRVTTAQLLFGSATATFDGTGDYLNLPYVPNYDLGSANCTIEYWFKPASVSVSQIHFEWRDSVATKGLAIYQSAGNPNKLSAVVGDSNTAAYEVSILGTTTLVVGTLYHARLVKNGTNWQLYLNGVAQGSATSSVIPYLNSAAIFFGAARDATTGFNGQAADLRITKVARNSSGFTPPSSRLGKYERQANHSDFKVLLTFEGANNDTTINDQSDLALGVTLYGSAKITTSQYWAGSSCLDLDGEPNSMAWVAFHPSHRGSGANITIDCRIRTSNVARAGVIASNGVGSLSPRAGWLIGITSDGKLFAQGFIDGGGDAFSIIASSPLVVGTWYHVELVRNGTQWQLFQDGVLLGSATEAAVLGVSNTDVSIGRDQNTLVTWLGQIDEFAIRDFAVHTANFTPSSVSYYPIDSFWSSTVVLMPMTGANNSTLFENTAEITKTLTASGNAQISTAQSKFGGSSGLFDGTGDYITAPNTPLHSVASSDITIEAFVYPTSFGALRTIASKRPDGGSTEFTFGITATGQLGLTAWSASGTAVLALVSTETLALNQWSHVAASLSGTTWRLFINGQPVGSATATGAIGTNTTGLKIGREHSANPREWLGYQDGIRFTRGCRYIAAFTPSILEFGKYVPALNSQLRFELESVRDGLVSYQKHNVIVVRA